MCNILTLHAKLTIIYTYDDFITDKCLKFEIYMNSNLVGLLHQQILHHPIFSFFFFGNFGNGSPISFC